VFEALAKVNRTDVALKMLQATEYPSYGYNILGVEKASSLWESWDGATMQQWFDESSRDHHFTASINTFIRKYLGGLQQEYGQTGWQIVKCRPEAAVYPDLLDSASVHLASHRGNVSCSWRAKAVAPAPAPSPSTAAAVGLPVYCRASPQFPVPGGGLSSQSAPLNLSCPVGAKITDVVYARWGHPNFGEGLAPGQLPVRGHAWFCYGPQPPPAGQCEADTSQIVEKLCVGQEWCDLAAAANVQTMGDPCHLGESAGLPLAAGGYMLIARIRCSDPVPLAAAATQSSEVLAGPTSRHVSEPTQWAEVNATVPAGSTGEIHVPIQPSTSNSILESGQVVWRNGAFVPAAGVVKAALLGRFVAFETLSGEYNFVSFALAAPTSSKTDDYDPRAPIAGAVSGGWNSGVSSWLETPDASVKVVHVINSCHLDIGFADTARNIVNDYFDKHLPLAASVGESLRAGADTNFTNFTDTKLNFMFHSWIIDTYFDCPPAMGLHCPSAESRAKVSRAIAQGDITWQAFPHNAEPAIMDPALIKAGLEMTFALDEKFGQAHKRVLSQRDVPGLARGLIPILKGKGLTGISIGAHEDTTHAAKVPPCFVWRDAHSHQSIIVLYTYPGYGSLPIKNERVCIVEGAALVYNWGGDNHGPSSAAGYNGAWTTIAQSFPNATIRASTLDNFTQHLLTVQSQLPVVEQEIADDWIYGVASDPHKVTRMRVINRAYRALDDGHGALEDALARDTALRNATRFFLKNGEHTWGICKGWIHSPKDNNSNAPTNAWRNDDFARALTSNYSAHYARMETSWWEQRHWGITLGMEALQLGKDADPSSLAAKLLRALEDGFQELRPTVPSSAGYTVAHAGAVFKCGTSELGFDATGAISHFVRDGFTWADAGHALAQLKYRAYTGAEVGAEQSSGDYGKGGLPAEIQGGLWHTRLQALYAKQEGDACSFLMQSAFDAEVSSEYGAPATVWSKIDVARSNIIIDVVLVNKTRTRLPESLHLQFLPAPSYTETGKWSVDKLGSWLNVSDVVSGGCKHLHANMEGIRVDMAGHRMSIAANDSAVASFGNLTAYPYPIQPQPDTAQFGASFVLHDNLWGVNYVLWFPFNDTAPGAFAASDGFFPHTWNNHLMARFVITTEKLPSSSSSSSQRLKADDDDRARMEKDVDSLLQQGPYAEDGANFLCRRSFGIAPAAYPLPCRAPADDYTSPLGREFVIAAWGEPTISPVDVLCFGRPIPGSSTHPKTTWTYPGCNATCCNASALDQLDVYAKAHFTAVRTGLVNQFAQHWGQLPFPANASEALDALAGALRRIQKVGLRPIFTPGGFLTTRTLKGDWFGGADAFGGVSSCEMDDKLPPNNPLLCTPEMGKHHLTPPELAWIKAELDKRNLSQAIDMVFLHDDDFHVTGDTIASTEWLKDNWSGAPGMINGGLTDPLGLYSSRQFVFSAEQYYISNKGTIYYNISGPQGMLRTLLMSYTQSQQMAERFRLRPWPLFNLGDGEGLKAIESDSFVRVQVYAALALGAKGLDYYTWAAGVWNSGGTLPLPNNQSKGIPGLNYPIVCVVNADAKIWGNLLIGARHVGAISTLPPHCTSDAQCAPTCSGGTLGGTVPRCVSGGCQCPLVKDGSSPTAGPGMEPAPELPVTAMDTELLVGVFSSSSSGNSGFLMVIDTRVAMGIGVLPNRTVSIMVHPSCVPSVVPPGVERTLESLSPQITTTGGRHSGDGGGGGATATAVSLRLQAGDGALLRVVGPGCGDVLRGVRRWQYDPRSISGRWLFGRNVMTNNRIKWTPWQEDLDGLTQKDWTPWLQRAPTTRRAEMEPGGVKQREALIIGGSYHEDGSGIADALSARSLAEAGFVLISAPAAPAGTGNATAMEYALTWGSTYGFSVLSSSSSSNNSGGGGGNVSAGVFKAVENWACHTNYGGVLLDGRGDQQLIVSSATALRSAAYWGLPFAAGVSTVDQALELARLGVPLAAVAVLPPDLTLAAASAMAAGQHMLDLYSDLNTRLVDNSSTPASVAIAIEVCATDSDSLLRFAAFSSLATAFVPPPDRYNDEQMFHTPGMTGALWWDGMGACARIGSPKFDLLANINLRLTQAAWMDAFSRVGLSTYPGGGGGTRIWSTSSLHVPGSVAPGSQGPGGLLLEMSPELIVYEFAASTNINASSGIFYVLSSQLSLVAGGAPARTVSLKLRGSVTSSAAIEGGCFQGFSKCGLHRVGNLLPLTLPGGSGQLAQFVGPQKSTKAAN
jgi:hypothetical protein